ncbi:hypothetical protein [Streptomyces sp. NPDC002758]
MVPANTYLYEQGSDDVEAINVVFGERCNPHRRNFTDRLFRPALASATPAPSWVSPLDRALLAPISHKNECRTVVCIVNDSYH